jgi:hypothetical protein
MMAGFVLLHAGLELPRWRWDIFAGSDRHWRNVSTSASFNSTAHTEDSATVAVFFHYLRNFGSHQISGAGLRFALRRRYRSFCKA